MNNIENNKRLLTNENIIHKARSNPPFLRLCHLQSQDFTKKGS